MAIRINSGSYSPWWALGVILVLLAGTAYTADEGEQQKWYEINTVLMESTFKIEGPNSIGTGFLIGRPYLNDPSKSRLTLVTAAHVLEEIQGENAVLVMREKSEAGKWLKQRQVVRIRDGGKPLYVRHKNADVAAMYVSVPQNMISGPVLGIQLLAGDDMLRGFEVHPGDEIFALGYPLGAEANEAGFPVLRSGKIASYPLLPTDDVKTFLFDFRVFPGNSGGPVYFYGSNRAYKGSTHLGLVNFVIGLVSQERRMTEKIKELYGVREQSYSLGLAEVVHASLIKETVELLPPPGQ